MIRALLLLPLFFAPVIACAQFDSAQVRQLAHSKRWLRLLHYKSHFFSGYRSTIDAESFFFSKDGARDPEKELWATLAAFKDQTQAQISKLPQPPACAFPARFRFLNEELKLGLAMPACERWVEFLGRFNGHASTTLVFSTAYPNNPASMFGHTFLRINAQEQTGRKKQDLLDYGLSYAAQVPDDENNFSFIWFGLTGGYVGTFSAVPYYAKVQEYNNSESRDLWEYDLDLNQDETWWLLANVWEVEVNGYSKYFFFDENCSYEILALLEVAKPTWEVAQYDFHMIPGESIKKVARIPGAVREVKFRPSAFRKLTAKGERLNSAERAAFRAVLEGKALEHASVAVLDTAAEYFFYRKQQEGGHLSEEENGVFQEILLERSRRGPPADVGPFKGDESRPDLGHHASRISLGAGIQNGSNSAYGLFQELGIKFAYHDLLNHDAGFTPYSEINFPNFHFRYFPQEQRFWLHRLEILSIYSLSPFNWLKSSWSWNASLAYEVPQDLCSFCHVLRLQGGMGFSQPIAKDRIRTYELLGLGVEGGKSLDRGWRIGPNLRVGALANLSHRWKHHLEAALNSDPWRLGSPDRFYLSAFWGQSYFFSPEWETRLVFRASIPLESERKNRGEGLIQVLRYF